MGSHRVRHDRMTKHRQGCNKPENSYSGAGWALGRAHGDHGAVCPAQGCSVLPEQGLDRAGLVRAAVSLPSSLVTCKPHPVLCMSQCSRLGLGLAGAHLSHTPQSGSDPSSQHTARVGPSETLCGASSPGPAGLIITRDGRTGRRDGAGQNCSPHRLKHTTADTESHQASSATAAVGCARTKEGHRPVIATTLISERGPQAGSSQPVRNASYSKSLHPSHPFVHCMRRLFHPRRIL